MRGVGGRFIRRNAGDIRSSVNFGLGRKRTGVLLEQLRRLLEDMSGILEEPGELLEVS